MSTSAPGHRPGRKCHAVLHHLSGCASRQSVSDLMAAVNIDPHSARANRFPHLIRTMTRDGLIAGAAGLYWITADGVDALARLDLGETAPSSAAPSVRYFGRAASAVRLEPEVAG